MSTISLVMIVKDEIKILENCIESVKAIVDEFVIIDTGSTDGTQEIIKKFGELHEIPFSNFVDTKNEALKLAKSDYILFMDADERLLNGLEFLKEHAESGDHDLIYAKIVEKANGSIVNTYMRARLWKNDGRFKFVGPGVHEVISGEGRIISDHRIIALHDHSHRTPESYQDRFDKYVKILTSFLESNPSDSRATFYLARTYKDMGHWLTAIQYYRAYLDLNTTFQDERWQAAHDIAICWKSQGEYDRALEACKVSKEIDPRRAETFVLAGQIQFDLQDYENSRIAFEHARSLPIPTDVMLFLNPLTHFEIPTDFLVLLADKQHDYRHGREMVESMIERLVVPDQRLVNNLTWLRKMESQLIFFTLGNTPEPVYGGMIEDKGVGGVETTYLELPIELAKLGHTVIVFCKCKEEQKYEDVYFVPFEKINDFKSWTPDVIVTSRWYDPFYLFPNAKKIIWMQDAHFADPLKSDVYQICNTVVCSSRWHRQYIAERTGQGLDAKKIHIVPLAIRSELFNNDVERDPLKVIYSSNPDRGLFILMDMWDEITKQVPGIHLTITYGWEGLKTWSNDKAWLDKIASDQNGIETWATKSGNVKLTGRLTKKLLALEMQSSSLCLYPNNFWETFCLTALETQMAGVPMITTKIGALTTTLLDTGNILIDGDPFSPKYQKEFIDKTVELMYDRVRLHDLSLMCYSFARLQPNWKEVAHEWERIIWSSP
jgi:glycosyltransferase involved in cell wall biosynthesis